MRNTFSSTFSSKAVRVRHGDRVSSLSAAECQRQCPTRQAVPREDGERRQVAALERPNIQLSAASFTIDMPSPVVAMHCQPDHSIFCV
jgi:hypothetical protein